MPRAIDTEVELCLILIELIAPDQLCTAGS